MMEFIQNHWTYKNSSDVLIYIRRHIIIRCHLIIDSGDGPLAKYRRVLDEVINLTSTNRGFKTINHMVATYEQTKKGLSYFYPKRQVQDDGIHTKPLDL